jgi:hypothetical protein
MTTIFAGSVMQELRKLLSRIGQFGRGKMDDKEMESLKNKLEYLIRETNKLQQRYRKATGRRLIPPVRLDGFKSQFEVREVENGN